MAESLFPKYSNILDPAKRLLSGLYDEGINKTIGNSLLGFATVASLPRTLPAAARQAQKDAEEAKQKGLEISRRQQQGGISKDEYNRLNQEQTLARNRSAGLERSYGTFLEQTGKNSFSGGVKTLLSAGGVAAGAGSLAGTALLSGGIGGAISLLSGGNRDDVAEAVGRGVGQAPQFAGLNYGSSKLLQSVAGSQALAPLTASFRNANPYWQRLGKAGLLAGTNLLEDEFFTRSTELRAPTTEERIFSSAVGAITSPLVNLDDITRQADNPITKITNKDDKQPRDVLGRFAEKIRELAEKRFPSSESVKEELRQIIEGKRITDSSTGDSIKFDRRLGDRFTPAGGGIGRESAAGLLAGVEVYQDENGEYAVRYAPEKGILGLGLFAGLSRAQRQKIDEKVFAQINATPTPEASVKMLDKIVNDIVAGNTSEKVQTLKQVRAAINKYLEQSVVSGRNYKETYAFLKNIAGADNDEGRFVKAAFDQIERIDDIISQGLVDDVQEKVVRGGFDSVRDILKNSDYRKAINSDYKEWSRALRQQEGLVTATQLENSLYKQIKQSTGNAASNIVDQLNDLSNFTAGFRDLSRNLKSVFGKNFDIAEQTILKPLDNARAAFVDMQKELLDDLDTSIVKKLGITKGSKLSALVQEFGEGNIDEVTLRNIAGDDGAKKVIEADRWFRQKYDTLLDEVNAARARVYPNNPDKLIPRRDNYYRHFRELAEGFAGLKNIFDTPAQISSKLSGVSEFTRPKSKFLSFAQKRLGIETKIDAVGGFLDYIRAASYAKNIDPQTANLRAMAQDLADATAEGTENAGKLNNFIEYLHDLANDLSGKTNPLDRTIQKWIPGGRKTFRAINWLNNRVKANVILGNVSSSVAQIFNVPQGIADAGILNAGGGMARTIAGIFTDTPIKDSQFIKTRYADSMYDKFDTSMLDKGKNMAAWLTGVLDEVGTKYIWHAEYQKALSDGMEDPIRFADMRTRELVAGRGIGEVPLGQKSKVFQLIAPFQLEVANLWWVMKDWVDEKQFSKLAAFAAASFLFNRAAEEIRGSDVSFDPINAGIDAIRTYQEEEDKRVGAIRAGGRIFGEVASNVPFGQTLAARYDEYGTSGVASVVKSITGETITREELFGDKDPTRFGGGLLVSKGLDDPIFKLIPSFGGQQIKRSIEAAQTLVKGYSETAKGNIRFPVEPTARNIIQGLLFGQYSTPIAREYFERGGNKLGKNQSEYVRNAEDRTAAYYEILTARDDEKALNRTKEQVRKSQVATVEGKKYVYFEDGEVKTIDLDFLIKTPELTGTKYLDDKVLSNYKSELTKKENDVLKLYEHGVLTPRQAETALALYDLKKRLISQYQKELEKASEPPKQAKAKKVNYPSAVFTSPTVKRPRRVGRKNTKISIRAPRLTTNSFGGIKTQTITPDLSKITSARVR